MLARIVSFLHIFLLVTTRNASLAQEENSQETQLSKNNDHYESLLSSIEMKNKCDYKDPGQRFSNEINNVGKCMNPFFENENLLGNNVDAEKIDNRNDIRSLIALEIENYNNEDNEDICPFCNIYPNFEEICPVEQEN